MPNVVGHLKSSIKRMSKSNVRELRTIDPSLVYRKRLLGQLYRALKRLHFLQSRSLTSIPRRTPVPSRKERVMRWNAYINRRLKNGDIETSKEVFELPNTTRADGRFATLHASKTYNMNEDAILCIPGC